MNPRKICVVTGSRADYGLLRPVLKRIRSSASLELQLVVTGMHLADEFGGTVSEIKQDGYSITKIIETQLSSDSGVGVGKSTGLGIIGFSQALSELKPDLLLVLGDRYEIFASVVSALFQSIPVAHIAGGEVTEGAFDEAIRHSITKMAHIHFVAKKEYAKRVIQLGEQPKNVIVTGSLATEISSQEPLISASVLEKTLGFSLASPNILVTFHPITLAPHSSAEEFSELLLALDQLDWATILFTAPNSDSEGRELLAMTKEYCATRANCHFVHSLGSDQYYAALAFFDVIVGNSSSGISEAPEFGTPTINIGSRQKGRMRAPSVIDVSPDRHEIFTSICVALDSTKLERVPISLAGRKNHSRPASSHIVESLTSIDLSDICRKQFVDFPI